MHGMCGRWHVHSDIAELVLLVHVQSCMNMPHALGSAFQILERSPSIGLSNDIRFRQHKTHAALKAMQGGLTTCYQLMVAASMS